MRLLNTKNYELKTFARDIPNYAILSHTWRTNVEEEILFEDIQNPVDVWQPWQKKAASKKLFGFCEVAAEEGYSWVWIDTCSIDKSSSAELSEATNSMYRWYKDADVCYVYLEDVDWDSMSPRDLKDFKSSHWFTRGWTLQELLAPETVEFYDKIEKRLARRVASTILSQR